MEKVRELRARAKECRERAEKADAPSVREHYSRSAALWDKFADQRLKSIASLQIASRKTATPVEKNVVPEAFWGEISACEHFVQIYDADDQFLETLASFFGSALNQGNSAVAIATSPHLRELERRLAAAGFDLETAKRADRLILLDAETTISRFLIDGWPDEEKFANVVREILARAGHDGRKVSAFGEMVALMWANGYHAATIRLEHLWQQLCESKTFTLFCAYPKSGFTENPIESMAHVCEAHSKAFA
jgi:hypothetical protein